MAHGLSVSAGINIVRKALRQPCMQIALNAGVEASVIVSKVEEGKDDMGYDALNNEFVNMIERGIIDPTKVWLKATTQSLIICVSSSHSVFEILVCRL